MSSLPHEFLLVAACCRWPLGEAAIATIRQRAAEAVDWPYLIRIVKRQRVAGLVHNALSSATIELPGGVAQALASEAQIIAGQNLILAAETIRLQRAFDGAKIPVITLKGIALAQLAYGSLTLKHGKDIDLLVPRERAREALELLERDGYQLRRPARHLSAMQRDAALRYGLEFGLARRRLQLELRWRLTENPHVLTGPGPYSHTQDVVLSDSTTIRTLADDFLFAYLCVHGAGHGWSRLKWLADLNALIAKKSDAEIEHLYRYAEARDCGICAGQALLLCERLLQARLPPALARELASSKRLEILVAMALGVMTGTDSETEIEDRPFGSTRINIMQFLLGKKWRYLAAQCRILSVRLGDTIEYPLPAPLHFLYPLLRLPLWLWRRANWSAAHKLTNKVTKADNAARE